VKRLVVSAVGAILLASYLTWESLASRTDLVGHVIFKLVAPNLCPDYDNFFLGQLDGLVTLWTKIHAQSDQPAKQGPILRVGLMIVELRIPNDE